MNESPTPLGCFLSPRAASETIASLHVRILELERDLFTLRHAQQAKADRLARFAKEAARKAAHPAHLPEVWVMDEVLDPKEDPYAIPESRHRDPLQCFRTDPHEPFDWDDTSRFPQDPPIPEACRHGVCERRHEALCLVASIFLHGGFHVETPAESLLHRYLWRNGFYAMASFREPTLSAAVTPRSARFITKAPVTEPESSPSLADVLFDDHRHTPGEPTL